MRINKSHLIAVLIGMALAVSIVITVTITSEEGFEMPALEKREIYQGGIDSFNIEIIKSYYRDSDSVFVSVTVSNPKKKRSFGGVYVEEGNNKHWESVCYYCDKTKDVISAKAEMFINLTREMEGMIKKVQKPGNLVLVEK